jgi:hypothetical protein
MNGPIRAVSGTFVLVVLALSTGCVQAQPASDTGNTLSPTALSLPGPDQPLAYEPEMRQLFAADCVYCHGGYRVDDGYSMNTYEEVIRDLTGVVNTTQPGKKMYPYWSGSEATRRVKADMARRWVEVYKAQKTR